MQRILLALTENDRATLRGALRTAQMESGVSLTDTDKLLARLESAPALAERDWKAYENAAGELLEAGAESAPDHVNVKACERFARIMRQVFDRLK